MFVSKPLSNKCSCNTKQSKKANTCSLDTSKGGGGVKQTSVRPSEVLEQNFYKKDPFTSHYVTPPTFKNITPNRIKIKRPLDIPHPPMLYCICPLTIVNRAASSFIFQSRRWHIYNILFIF